MQRSQQLRTATQTRRSARAGFPEPDDFEGLPVRQWRQEWVTVAPTLPQEMTQQGDRWAVELPFGMPRESHLLPPHSQELLRAARSGRLYKRPAPTEEDEPDIEVEATKNEKKDWEPPNEGYMVKMWKQIPRNAETQTVSHLAKRHKNTVTLASRAAAAPVTGPTVIRATVRRIDAAGNPYEQTVTLTEGQQVDGEIISTTVVPAPVPAQELPVQQATPARRRPPPPKRKAKGVGRGRKKGKLPLPLPATRSQATALEGAPAVKTEAVGADGIKIEDMEDSANQDSEMADISGIPSDDDDEGEGGEGEEDEEGEEEGGDDAAGDETSNVETGNSDAQGQETEDAEMSEAIQPTSVEEAEESRPSASDEEVIMPKVRFQPPTLGSLASSRIEGSPLKNVMVQSPTEPSPVISTNPPFSISGSLEVPSSAMSMDGSSNVPSQSFATEATVEGVREETATEQVVSQATEAAALPAEATPPVPTREMVEVTTTASDQMQEAPEQPSLPPANETSEPPPEDTRTARTGEAPEVSLQPPDSPALLPTVTEDEDDGLNLLGSLERELDRQEGMSSSASSGGGGEEGKATPNPSTATATATAEGAGTEPAMAAASGETGGGVASSTDDAQAEQSADGAAAPVVSGDGS
ncbi:hypothetical protein VTI74DRAFT_3845 [Chaetomium olivicolor]